MESEPNQGPGSPPILASGGDLGDDTELMNMSMDLISKLRAAIDAKAHLKGEVERMKKDIYLIDLSRKFVEWDKKKVEEELEDECEKRNQAEERLEAARKKKQEDGVTIGELRSKICGLAEELEKCKEQCEKGKKAEERYEELLEAAKKKEQEDGNMIAELKSKNSELEEELKKCEEQCPKGKKAGKRYEELLEAAKKKEQEDGDMIAELRSKIRKLENEKREAEEYWRRKFMEVKEWVLKFGKDIELLMSGGETNGIHVHCRESGNNNADSTPCQRNGDTSSCTVQYPSNPNKDTPGMGILEASMLGTLIYYKFECYG